MLGPQQWELSTDQDPPGLGTAESCTADDLQEAGVNLQIGAPTAG